ncbi:hypothetical protein QCI47_20025 [Bacillus cereus group sp. RP29]|uniref:hypothetical protein n=1 Tax=Bacillus cereus group sp. RP29 TaxID=3040257 RepID=UPI003398A23F
MTQNLKKYCPLQVLRETDAYMWMCRKEIFKETVVNEPSLIHHRTLLDELEDDILQGNMTRMTARQARQLIQ